MLAGGISRGALFVDAGMMRAALVVMLVASRSGASNATGIASRCPGNKTAAQLRGGDLTGCHFAVTVIETSPYLFLQEGEYVGYFVDVLRELQDRAGFTYDLLEAWSQSALCPPDKPPPFACAIELTSQGISDITLAHLYATSGRASDTLLTQSIYLDNGLAYITKEETEKSESMSERYLTIFAPFSGEVWLHVILTFPLLVGLVLWILEKSESDGDFGSYVVFLWHSEKFDPMTIAHAIFYTYFLAFSTLTGAHAHAPRTVAGKLLSGFWQFFCIVVVAAYTAELAAYLSMDKVVVPRFSDWKSLSDAGVTVCTKGRTTSAYGIWMDDYEPNMKQYDFANETTMMKIGARTTIEMMEYFEDGKCEAVISSLSDLTDYLQKNKKCGGDGGLQNAVLVGDGKEGESSTFPAFVAPGLAGVDSALSFHIMAMHRDRTLERIKNEWLKESASCDSAGDESRALDFTAMFGLFVPMWGIVGALLLWILIEERADVRELLLASYRRASGVRSGTLLSFIREAGFDVNQNCRMEGEEADAFIIAFEDDPQLRLDLVAPVKTHLRLRDLETADIWTKACRKTAEDDAARLLEEKCGVHLTEQGVYANDSHELHAARYTQRSILVQVLQAEVDIEDARILKGRSEGVLPVGVSAELKKLVIATLHERKLLHSVADVMAACRENAGTGLSDQAAAVINGNDKGLLLLSMYRRTRQEFQHHFRNCLATQFHLDLAAHAARQEREDTRHKQKDIREGLLEYLDESAEWAAFCTSLAMAYNSIDPSYAARKNVRNMGRRASADANTLAKKHLQRAFSKPSKAASDDDPFPGDTFALTLSDLAWGLTLADMFLIGRRFVEISVTVTQKKYEACAARLKDKLSAEKPMDVMKSPSNSVRNSLRDSFVREWSSNEAFDKVNEGTIVVAEETMLGAGSSSSVILHQLHQSEFDENEGTACCTHEESDYFCGMTNEQFNGRAPR